MPGVSPQVALQRINRFADNPDWKVDRRDPQYSPIGMVQRVRELDSDPSSAGRATAFYIGPCLVVTNYHVVYGNTLKPSRDVNYDLKISIGVTLAGEFSDYSIIKVSDHGDMDDNGQYDWAILSDSKCLGRKYGWYPLASTRTRALIEGKTQVFIVGYATDRPVDELYASRGRVVGVHEYSGNVLFSASEAPGDSGGPVFLFEGARLKVVGLNKGGLKDKDTYRFDHYSQERASQFVNVGDIVNSLERDSLVTNEMNPWEGILYTSPLNSAPAKLREPNLRDP